MCDVLVLNACILPWFENINVTLFLVSYKLLFCCEPCVQNYMLKLGFVSSFASLTHHILGKAFVSNILLLPLLPIIFLGRLLFLVGPCFTPLNIWFNIAFLSWFCKCFNCFFYFKGLFFYFDSSHKSFLRTKTLKDLVLFIKTETLNVYIKTVPKIIPPEGFIESQNMVRLYSSPQFLWVKLSSLIMSFKFLTT